MLTATLKFFPILIISSFLSFIFIFFNLFNIILNLLCWFILAWLSVPMGIKVTIWIEVALWVEVSIWIKVALRVEVRVEAIMVIEGRISEMHEGEGRREKEDKQNFHQFSFSIE